MNSLAWFPYSVAGTILLATSVALYKLPGQRGQSRFVTSFWALMVPAICSVVLFWKFLAGGTPWHVMIYGALWGISFVGLSLLQMYALEHVDTNVLFPLTAPGSLMLTVLIGFTFFNERMSVVQFIGVLLILFTVLFFAKNRIEMPHQKAAIWIGALLIFLSVFNKIVQKLAVDQYDFRAFQIWQYVFALAAVMIVITYKHKGEFKKAFSRQASMDGLLIGAFSFGGGYFYLAALSRGPISLINAVHSLYIVVTATIGYFLFKEKFNKRRAFLIGVALISLLLIRLG